MKIFVKNLSEKVKAEELRKAAEEFGEIESVSIVKDPKTEKSLGIAYIETTSKEDGKAVIKGLKGIEFNGKKLTVKEAEADNAKEIPDKPAKSWQSSKFSGAPRKGFKSNIRIGGANRGR
ncbi:MAG: RNA-binding protein [Spirochaetia bacterium]|nr:RNA-binding protein [Spirochaetia bacterium]